MPDFQTIRAACLLVFAVLILSACARGDDRPVVGAGLDGEPPEALWHLRAGLNVAALSCQGRGRKSVRNAYHRMLAKHRTALEQAYQAEERRHGKAGLDRHQTKLYNRFSNQRRPARFCKAAASIAGRANGMDSARLASNSRKLLSELQSHLR